MGNSGRNQRYFLLSAFFGPVGLLSLLFLGFLLLAPPSQLFTEPLAPSVASASSLAHTGQGNSSPQLKAQINKHPLVQGGSTLTGTLLLTKTVGTDPNVCTDATTINVLSGTPVYFCYTVENLTTATLTGHELLDGTLPPQATSNYLLPPGEITQTIRGPITVTASIIDPTETTALWTAFEGLAAITATAAASVQVIAPTIQVNEYVQPLITGTAATACNGVSNLVIPAGVNLQHCISITNVGNTALVNVTIDVPSLGINALTFAQLIPPTESYEFTLQEAQNRGVGTNFSQENIQSSQRTTVTVTAQTTDGFEVTGTSSSNVTLDGSINVDAELRASTRSGACDNVFAVSSQTLVYFCIQITNSGTEILTTQWLRNNSLTNQDQSLPVDLAPGEIFTQTFNSNSRTITAPITETLRYEAAVAIDGWGLALITRDVTKYVGLVAQSLTPTRVPTPSPTWTPVPPGATATPTQKPINTSTPFPTLTPTVTFTPLPSTAVPTHTPISPLPTPIPTPTRAIIVAVQSPVPTLTFTPTPSPSPTVDTVATNAAQQATSVAASAATATDMAITSTASARLALADNGADLTDGSADEIALASDSQISPLPTPQSGVQPPDITQSSPLPTPLPTETALPTIEPTVTDAPTPEPIAVPATEEASEEGRKTAVTQGDNITSTQRVASVAVDNASMGIDGAVQPRGLLLLAQVIDAAVAAATWIWFLCGSVVFFAVAGLMVGLFFRQQERNRFQLMEVPDENLPTSIFATDEVKGASTGATSQRASSQDAKQGTAKRVASPSESNADDSADWPASLP